MTSQAGMTGAGPPGLMTANAQPQTLPPSTQVTITPSTLCNGTWYPRGGEKKILDDASEVS